MYIALVRYNPDRYRYTISLWFTFFDQSESVAEPYRDGLIEVYEAQCGNRLQPRVRDWRDNSLADNSLADNSFFLSYPLTLGTLTS